VCDPRKDEKPGASIPGEGVMNWPSIPSSTTGFFWIATIPQGPEADLDSAVGWCI